MRIAHSESCTTKEALIEFNEMSLFSPQTTATSFGSDRWVGFHRQRILRASGFSLTKEAHAINIRSLNLCQFRGDININRFVGMAALPSNRRICLLCSDGLKSISVSRGFKHGGCSDIRGGCRSEAVPQ